MSHTTEIKSVPIRDLTALRQAVERLKAKGVNCDLLEKAKPRMYFREQEVMCDYVLKLHGGKYDVGFVKQADGSYSPIYDEYNNYVGEHLANPACPMPGTDEERAMKQLGMFSQEYARCAAVNAAAASGFYVESETQDNKGNYQIQFTN